MTRPQNGSYPRGESYLDMIHRLEPMVRETAQQNGLESIGLDLIRIDPIAGARDGAPP